MQDREPSTFESIWSGNVVAGQWREQPASLWNFLKSDRDEVLVVREPFGDRCIAADTVSIAPQVFDLLDYLIRNRERVVSKDDLINAIWNGRIVSDAALTTRLNAARGAIGDSGEQQRLIKTLPRKGFRFVGDVLRRATCGYGNCPRPERTAPAVSHATR